MEETFWDQRIETITGEELKKLQLFRLKETIKRVSTSSLFYRSLFKQYNIQPEKLNTLEDIINFPLISRQDISSHYPYGLLSVERCDVVRFHGGSSAFAPKKGIFYTQDDLRAWSSLVARSFYTAGIRTTDILQVLTEFGLHTTGYGCEIGGEELGILVIPAGNISMFRNVQLMRELGTTALYIPAGMLNNLLDTFYEFNFTPCVDTELRMLIVGEDPITAQQKELLENKWKMPIYCSYGILEINSPGMAIECSEEKGMHIWEDYFFIEILDPQTLKPLKDGEWGELVITTLNQEAMPLIRYRTGDITRIIPEPCACGRNHKRIEYIQKRTDDLFFIQGRALYPTQIAETLKRVPEVGDNYVIYLETIEGKDELIIEIEVIDNLYLDNFGKLEMLTKNIASKIFEETRINPKIKLVQYNYFHNQHYNTLCQVIDRRKNK